MASQFVRKITKTTTQEPIKSLENGDIIITKDNAYINVNGEYVELGKVYDDTVIKADIKSLQDSITDINTKLTSIDDRVKALETDNTKNKTDITDLDTRVKALETPAG